MSRKLECIVSTVLVLAALIAFIACVNVNRSNRVMRQRMADARLQWLARVEDESGIEIGMLYRWTDKDACLLAGYDSVTQIPCP